MQKLFVVAAVAVACFFLARRLWKSVRRPDTISCGCSCSGCAQSSSCLPPEKLTPPADKP
ncbi:MAG: FeoB-associated Cys-rich membrane protein [Desulfobulbus sp.]|nr:FeoB-associated Cys-rich membrane protein [Desulfobulbus sp.]